MNEGDRRTQLSNFVDLNGKKNSKGRKKYVRQIKHVSWMNKKWKMKEEKRKEEETVRRVCERPYAIL